MNKTTAERLADKKSGHRSEVSHGIGGKKRRKVKKALTRADRRAAKAFCRAAAR